MGWTYRGDEQPVYNYQSTAEATLSKGVSPSKLGTILTPRNMHTGNAPAISATPGSAQTPVITETYLAEIFVPATVSVTGIAVFNGTDVTGNVMLGIYDTLGNLLGATASTAGSGTAQYQRVPLTAALVLVGPATYYIGRQASSATARPCAHTAGNFGAGKNTGDTYGTLPTAPTIPTTFTTALGPIASLY